MSLASRRPRSGPRFNYPGYASALDRDGAGHAGNFYVALAGERDPVRVLKIIREHMKPGQRVFIGVVAPIDPRIESPQEERDRTLDAAKYIPTEQLGTTDDCGFSPFSDDTSTSRETAFEKIRARVLGTALAAHVLQDKTCRTVRARRDRGDRHGAISGSLTE